MAHVCVLSTLTYATIIHCQKLTFLLHLTYICMYCFLCDPLHKCSNLEWLLIAPSFALLSVDMYITYLAALS